MNYYRIHEDLKLCRDGDKVILKKGKNRIGKDFVFLSEPFANLTAAEVVRNWALSGYATKAEVYTASLFLNEELNVERPEHPISTKITKNENEKLSAVLHTLVTDKKEYIRTALSKALEDDIQKYNIVVTEVKTEGTKQKSRRKAKSKKSGS